MSKMNNINITKEQLDDMKIRKYSIDNKPKIWVSESTLYKKDDNNIIKLHKEDFEILSGYPELEKCVFPENTFSVDGKYMGYTTTYYSDYKSLCYRMNKNKYNINQKKKLMRKIVKLIIKLNENDIVHADLNTSNIICNGKDIKLIDFDRIRLKEDTDPASYMWRLREEINYLNISLLTLLLDIDLINIMDSEYKSLINEIPFINEFKEYLIKCSSCKIDEIPKELLEYIDSIKKSDILKGKEFAKTLQL